MTKKKNNKTVSIITITQLKRYECLEILLDIIKNQTYKNIIEWIIVEGSNTREDSITNETKINKMIETRKDELNFPIVFVPRQSDKNIKLGELRNIGNRKCSGDITVCMDDDDYYFPNRVSHAVDKLVNSQLLIAGCSNHLMYDYDLEILVQMKTFRPNHSINSCMAWKKEYLEKNSHDDTKEFAEEPSFTKNFTEPMIALDPFSTVILSSHNFNTFSKKKFFIQKKNNIDCLVEKEINEKINKYIPDELLSKYKNLFVNNDTEDWDIVYMCGTFSISWDPQDSKLGGSEQAVVNISENWVKLGKKVIVYGEVPNKTVEGVVYKNWCYFNLNKKYKNIILWRNYGIFTILPFNKLKADNIILDLHDNFLVETDIIKKYKHKFNKILLKSNYHKECFLKQIDENYDNNKFVIIPNGVRVEKFSICPTGIQRNPYRFCYCSCYTRGLDVIITKLWPIIYTYEPRAELHVYYGMDGIRDEQYKSYLRNLLSMPGIMDHGRQPTDIIIREKYMSTFHFYLTNTQAEIDCISIKESVVTKCIPLISNFGVFKERVGMHFDFNDDTNIKLSAIKIIELLKNQDKVEEIRNTLINDNTIINWMDVSKLWLEYLI
jgi:hypothetical protein